MPRDFNRASLAEIEDKIRFSQAHPGDHLCIPFQCPNCQSQNIRGRSIDTSLIHDLVFECMVVQATLDAFWSRASKMVGNHVREVRNMAQYGRMFRYPPRMPVLGLWPLYTHLGMDAAVMVLMRSLEKGKGDKNDEVWNGKKDARHTHCPVGILPFRRERHDSVIRIGQGAFCCHTMPQ